MQTITASATVQSSCSCGKRDEQHAHRHHERRDLRRRRHERGDGRRRALVDVRRPHVERRGRDLEREPDDQHREPRDEEEPVGVARGLGDPRRTRALRSRRRRAREPKSRIAEPKLPTIRYLSPASSDASAVDADRRQDVEGDREPLEAEEERHQRVRLDEERHPGDRGEEQRVVLDDALAIVGQVRGRVLAAWRAALPVRDADREQARRRTRGSARTRRAGRGRASRARASTAASSMPKRTPATMPAARSDAAATNAPNGRRQPRGSRTPTTRHERRRAQQDEGRRERRPVDVRLHELGHGPPSTRPVTVPPGSPPKTWSVIPAGQNERTRSTSDERADDRDLGRAEVERVRGHRRAGLLVQHGRDEPEHVHRREHDRARSDDRPAPAVDEDAVQDQELPGERGRERHGERDHADRDEERREPRPSARHAAEAPELARSRCAARSCPRGGRARPRRGRGRRIWRSAPFRPESFTAKRPRTIRHIWARLEYAITPRTSGARKARSEP